jgi:predicted AlkP superfamily phosphohydrolase/phosphomutase/Flp pilus assembly protein TadD
MKSKPTTEPADLADAAPRGTFRNRLLIVGWDAADWKVIKPLMHAGEMPHLAKLVAEGVAGDITTLQPILSPMLWNSIATGQTADKHGVLGFTEVCPTTGGVRPVSSVSRTARALWNIVNVAGGRSHVVNWFCSHPAEPINGLYVTDACAQRVVRTGGLPKLPPDTFHVPDDLMDEELGRTPDKLNDLRVRPAEIHPNILRLFVPRAAEIDQKKDRRLATLGGMLAEAFTVHNYAVMAVQSEPWDLTAVYYPSIDHFSHGFMNYHGERFAPVTEEDQALFHDVVNGAYRLHDHMLGRLLHLVGDETTVMLLSDHGFHSDHLRPTRIPKTPTGPEVQHRPIGIVAMRGPGIRAGERIYGASLLDIAPTALTLLGLPVGADMPGRVLAEAFVETPGVEMIPTWEEVPGADGRPVGPYVLPAEDADALLEQFVELGYIDPIDNDRNRAAEQTRREARWNLARVYLAKQRADLALPILLEVNEQAPDRVDVLLTIAETIGSIGYAKEAAVLLGPIVEAERGGPRALYLLGIAAQQMGRAGEGVEYLQAAEAAGFGSAGIQVRLGYAYLRHRRSDDADRAFTRAAELDPGEPTAYLGRAISALRRHRFEDAALDALRAIGLQRESPRAHAILGRALVGLGRIDEAISALEVTVKLRPAALPAARLLVRLYGSRPDGVVGVARHKLAIREQTAQRKLQSAMRQEWRDGLRQPIAQCVERQAKYAARQAEARTPCDVVVVSGLPRSGTSVMMQMLQAGGLPILSDGIRMADEDNPEGYLEWEAVKRLGSQPELIREADGKAVKAISMLVHLLPAGHRYKVIYMDRPAAEVVASQAKMIGRKGLDKGLDPAATHPLQNGKLLQRHRDAAVAHLKSRKDVELLIVPYPNLVRDATAEAARVAEFLGAERLPEAESMVGAVRPSLHRNREVPAAAN